MARIKTNPEVFILLILTLITGSFSNDHDSFIDVIRGKVEEYNSLYTEEKTLMLTDRFVYRPGDELWFKSFVLSCGENQMHSSDLFIRMISSSGEEVIYRRYPLQGNEAEGRIVIPRSCIPGRYWLVGYTGWMKNQPPSEAFRKEILVSKYYEKRFTVQVLFDKFSYTKTDTVIAHIQILDPLGKPVPQTNFDYSIGSMDKPGIKGSGITDIKGKALISGPVEESEDLMLLNIEIRGHKIWGNYSTIIPVINEQPDITFFPEGGNLVAGINNVVAMKAVNKFGLPVTISGVITNSNDSIIKSVTTNISGMCRFEITPGSDTLFLKITQPVAFSGKYMMPPAKENGVAISYLVSDTENALFHTSVAQHDSAETYWIATSNRNIIWSKLINCYGSDTVKIPLNLLSTGLIQISVFNAMHQLIYDRLFMPSGKNQFGVKLQNIIFHSRQRVNLLIDFPEAMENQDIALAVSLNKLNHNQADNSIAAINAENSSWFCSADFNDLDLLTSTYRFLNWTDVLNMPAQRNPYRKQDGLSGTVKDKKDNISQHAKIRATYFPGFGVYETQSDENGAFNIEFSSEIIDFRFLNVDAYDAMGKTSLNASFDYSYVKQLNEVLVDKSGHNLRQKISDIYNYGEPDLLYVLRYGPGKFRNSHNDKRKKYDPFQYSKYTDIMDIIQDIQPYRLSGNKIIFTDRKNKADSVSMEEAIIVVNGLLRGNDINVLKSILPSDITNINISNYLLDVHKYTPLNFGSVIEITTIQGLYRYRQPHMQTSAGILSADRGFYSPDYAVESSPSTDNRRTLYWNPKIRLQHGHSVLVTFYTSDIKGIFSGILMGIDKNGKPVQGEFSFKVE